MKAVIVYESMYGNTPALANSGRPGGGRRAYARSWHEPSREPQGGG